MARRTHSLLWCAMAEGGENGTRKEMAAGRSARARARHRRRADALRANLARRKTQARARTGADGVDGADGMETAPPDSSGGSGSGG